MPLGPRRVSRPIRRERRRLQWVTFSQGGLSFTTGQSRTFDLLADAAFPLDHGGLTIVRTEFMLSLRQTTIGDLWSLGTYVTRLADVGTVEPNSFSRPDLWWVWWDVVYSSFTGATVDSCQLYRMTSKTKRKLHGAADTYVINLTNQSASTRLADVTVRTLVALP